jgi:hypothetical protein
MQPVRHTQGILGPISLVILLLLLFASGLVPAELGADVEVLIPGGSRSILARSGDPLNGGGVLRSRFDQIYWFPEPPGDRGELFVNHEIDAPDGGLSRLRYENGAITERRDWVMGTHNNCAGSRSPWGTILSCEESPPENDFTVGFVVEVDPTTQHQWERKQAMGRFSHEGCVVDPLTGDFYMTDDTKTGVFFRFVPDLPGSLDSGSLYALRESTEEWILITDMIHAEEQAIALGATTHPRPEDLAYNPTDDAIYIMVTGDDEDPVTWFGYILRFDPRSRAMTRWLDGDGPLIANPDNVAVDSIGNLLVHEDKYEANLDAFGANKLVLVRSDRSTDVVLRGLDTVGEVTGLTFDDGSDDRFWVSWQRGATATSELIEVELPAGWNAPPISVDPAAPSPAAVLGLTAAPNPFATGIWLDAEVARGGRVRLEIYDLRGAHWRTLVDGRHAGGRLRVRWDGRDAENRLAPSGLYFVRLIAGGRVATSKLGFIR